MSAKKDPEYEKKVNEEYERIKNEYKIDHTPDERFYPKKDVVENFSKEEEEENEERGEEGKREDESEGIVKSSSEDFNRGLYEESSGENEGGGEGGRSGDREEEKGEAEEKYYLIDDEDDGKDEYKDLLISLLSEKVGHNNGDRRHADNRVVPDKGGRESVPQSQGGERLKLEDFDYDENKYEQYIRNEIINESKTNDVVTNFNKKVDKYLNDGKKYGSKFDIGRKLVESSFSDIQLSALIEKTGDPSKVVAILGRNPSLIKELKNCGDAIDFCIKIHNIEKSIRSVKDVKPKTNPEKMVKSSGNQGKKISTDHLSRLAEAAISSGDGSELYNALYGKS